MSQLGADTALQCAEVQEDEITVLESIYPSLVSVQPNPQDRPGKLLNISIPISLPSIFIATLSNVEHQASSSSSSSSSAPTLELSHLPPISLRLHLPSDYPLHSPPRAIGIRASLPNDGGPQGWLSRSTLAEIQDRIRMMWKEDKESMGEGSGMIWRWWEWISSGDFLQDLNLIGNGQLNLSVPPLIPASTFHTILKTYNAAQIHSSFESTAFSCSICLENRKGKSCIKMPNCGCVFCTPCLSSCWTLAIEEGTLENVSCPSVSCVKARATRNGGSEQEDIESELVASVVGTVLKDRWQSLKEKRKAEIDPTYTVCPRPNCQAAVPPPPLSTAADLAAQASLSSRAIRLSDLSKTPAFPSEPVEPKPAPPIASEDRWARYRLCPSCDYSFCLYCSATWHGPHTACAFPQTSALVLEYLSYPENSEDRRRMEARRGKANLERMVSKWREDEENRRWLESRTRPCAGCGVRVEKSHGCNHMTCGRCNAHFCYRCGDSISPQDPYAHYRRPGHACYQKLFDEEEIARFERETAAGIAGVPIADDVVVDDWREYRGVWEW